MKLLNFKNIGEVLVFERIRPKIRKYLLKAGITDVPYGLYGKMFYITIPFSFILYLLFIYNHIRFSVLAFFFWSIMSLLVIDVMLVFAFMIGLWIYYSTRIYKRTKKIEEVLPMFLESVKINLEAGMSFDEALLGSIGPDFSVLKDEIEIVAEKSMTGKDTEQALREFSSKYDSMLLTESVDLLSIGLSGGAKMTDILDRLIESINLNNYLKKTVLSNVMSYVIFITLISIFISPILFALSYNLLVMFEGFGAKLGSSATEYLAIEFKTLVERDNFVFFSRFCISLIAFFASLIIVNLRKGSIKGGLKYIPFYVGGSLIIYEISFRLLIFAFGGIS